MYYGWTQYVALWRYYFGSTNFSEGFWPTNITTMVLKSRALNNYVFSDSFLLFLEFRN